MAERRATIVDDVGSVELREDVGGSVDDAVGELRGLIEDNTAQ